MSTKLCRTIGESAIFRTDVRYCGFDVARANGPTGTTGSSAGDSSWSPHEGRVQECSAMLLLDHRSASWVAIHRAARISDALGAKLYTVLVMPRGTSARRPSLVSAQVADVLKTMCPRAGFDLEVVHGSATDLGIQIANASEPIVVVVDPAFGTKNVCRMVDTLQVPVLVAREARPAGGLVAASDMLNLRFPVLSLGREYARALARCVTFFHNAEPTPVFLADPMAGPGSYSGMLELQEEVATAKLARLRNLAGNDDDVDVILARAPSTVTAILALAQERDADVVVVGHRPRSRLSRLLGRGVTRHIVDRSRSSVLIVPIAMDEFHAAA